MKYTEDELERYVHFPEQLSDEQRVDIERYIKQNALAQEFIIETKRFRDEQRMRQSQEPSLDDERIAKKAFRTSGKSLSDGRELQKELFSANVDKHWLSTHPLASVIRLYPARSVAAASLLAAAIVYAIFFIRTPADLNPSFAETKENTLTVYNSLGEILFTKPAPGIPLYSAGGEYFNQFTRPFLIADTDGDGLNEVLTNLYNRKNALSSNGLICYNNKGVEQWRYSAMVDLTRIDQGIKMATRSEIFDYVVLPRKGNLRPRLFVVIADPTFSASSVVEVDHMTGKHLQQYWHTGGINKIFLSDVNRDGKTELLISGINDHTEMVFAAGLNPDFMDGGTSTSYQGFYQGGIVQELFYMTFPPTVFYLKHAFVKFNTLWSLRTLFVNDQCFEVQTNEIPPKLGGEIGGGIHYIIDKTLGISSIGINSTFEKIYNDNRDTMDKSLPPLDKIYLEHLRANVRWWDGYSFISQPTFNRKYQPH